jgi:hypothetical protein
MNRKFNKVEYHYLIAAHRKTVLAHTAVVLVNGVTCYLNALAFFNGGNLVNKIMAFANGLVGMAFVYLVFKSLQRIRELKEERANENTSSD